MITEKTVPAVSRRSLLTGGLATGFLLAFHLPLRAAVNEPEQPKDTTDGKFAPNAFIRIEDTGRTVLIMPQVEMGQGIYTSIAMILAEELDADWTKVAVLHAPPNDQLYANPAFGLQATGGSTSVRAWWKPLRTAGASARAMLVQAAAAQWQVEPASCTTSKGEVVHAASGRKLGYGELALAAQGQTPPKDVPVKDPKDFVIIGQPLKRLDTPDKVNGKAVYGIDAILPGMKIAAIANCPVFGGKVGKVDDSAAVKIPGVRKIVVLEDTVAVIGDHMWAAKKGLDALEIEWNEGPNAKLSTEDIWQHLRAASAKDGVVAKSVGDIAKGLASGDRFEASFELPFLAHASMEPINATVHVRPDACEIWTGTQIMTRVQSEAAKAAGLPVDKVIVNQHLLGGGFGRKLEPDMVVAAVKIAKQVDYPVKVIWTREEDIQHDVYRPVYRDQITASLVDGKVAAWKYKVAGSAVIARWLPPAFQKGIDIDAVDAAVDAPYDFANFHVEYVRAEPPAVPTGFWRGVGPNNNVFAVECAMDELARKAGKDPVEFRRSMLTKNPRMLAVLNLAAEKSGWGQALPPRVARGVCVQPSFASFLATVVEAEIDDIGEIVLRRITSAVDTGIAVNPDTVKAQIEGGLVFGLTAALYGEITIEKGRVQQSNFHDYRMMRINEMPKIEVVVVKSGEAPGGIGEAGVNAGPPALRNAIYAATGVALRRLPIDRKLLAAGKKA
ncbi:xanthine dehydrogenase family protein molybdopterin-binding subunit [Bradyrhizobium sp. WSM471]|uniref:xanthine dehydrogenase family protein molybdopterin-binding subunit n=1 Tax=Bradyrhizobium sp. WSM471 TaxID=319017 RepID=UPI00024D221B|nr:MULTISPECIES: xanthine dehydrogenase family protein molybdopterin-binding subunit [Bradyrhizobium]EHR00743.1 aerobic-type carbon monoxide dehydrogenase, large subunit CoxL/CutL-like protein [Bradyrhizobium sp. WSM471]UFW42828.1 xanthine dehydrogenase family protein molybdopterin-binding subunit [Bradyrhizobium canariense]